MNTSSNRDVHRFLTEKGFLLCAPAASAKASYEGAIPYRGEKIRVRLDVIDWNFQNKPEIFILERPEGLVGFRPHLGAGGNVCYLDRESVYMDAYDPVGVIARCLLEAQDTLEEIAGSTRKIDMRDEFLANWTTQIYAATVVWDPLPAIGRPLSTLVVNLRHHNGICAVTDSISRTSEWFTATGASVGPSYVDNAIELKSSKFPEIDPDEWPPSKFRDVLEWIKGWDDSVYRALHNRLESEWSAGTSLKLVLFSTPTGRFGFSFNVGYQDSSHETRLKKKRADRRQWIITSNPEIHRFGFCDLSPSFIHARNQENRETLRGKSIAVVGCGAVGGYLATFLTKLGAGDDGGILKLYETQELHPENLGRHVLSISDLFRNKADGVAELIARDFPYLDVKVRPVDALAATDLFDVDLIIDATGSSSVSSAINRRHLNHLKLKTSSASVIYSWVEGPGDAVRALIVDSLEFMCQECLLVRQAGQPPSDRFPVSLREAGFGREYAGGCGSYMPFAVSASVSAASLALDAARDWMRGNPSPRLRARRLNRRYTNAREDNSPKPLDTCPACRAK